MHLRSTRRASNCIGVTRLLSEVTQTKVTRTEITETEVTRTEVRATGPKDAISHLSLSWSLRFADLRSSPKSVFFFCKKSETC